jgi:hypothetical protein
MLDNTAVVWPLRTGVYLVIGAWCLVIINLSNAFIGIGANLLSK